MRHPIRISGAAGANPLFRKPRLLIAEQRNRPRGALIVRQTQAFVRDRAPLETYGVGSNRGPATPDSCDWSRDTSRSWPRDGRERANHSSRPALWYPVRSGKGPNVVRATTREMACAGASCLASPDLPDSLVVGDPAEGDHFAAPRAGTALRSESWTHSLLVRSWVDCITNMSGFDLRQAQPTNSIYKDTA